MTNCLKIVETRRLMLAIVNGWCLVGRGEHSTHVETPLLLNAIPCLNFPQHKLPLPPSDIWNLERRTALKLFVKSRRRERTWGSAPRGKTAYESSPLLVYTALVYHSGCEGYEGGWEETAPDLSVSFCLMWRLDENRRPFVTHAGWDKDDSTSILNPSVRTFEIRAKEASCLKPA